MISGVLKIEHNFRSLNETKGPAETCLYKIDQERFYSQFSLSFAKYELKYIDFKSLQTALHIYLYIYLFIQLRLLLLKHYKYHAQINLNTDMAGNLQQRYQPITAGIYYI